MKWEDLVYIFRIIRREGIPVQLGVNTVLLSPWIPSKDDTGWRLRIIQKVFSPHLDQIQSISEKFGLNTKFVENKSKKYMEIYRSGYNDPIHLHKESIDTAPVIATIS